MILSYSELYCTPSPLRNNDVMVVTVVAHILQMVMDATKVVLIQVKELMLLYVQLVLLLQVLMVKLIVILMVADTSHSHGMVVVLQQR